jgi:hypothetical protein
MQSRPSKAKSTGHVDGMVMLRGGRGGEGDAEDEGETVARSTWAHKYPLRPITYDSGTGKTTVVDVDLVVVGCGGLTMGPGELCKARPR